MRQCTHMPCRRSTVGTDQSQRQSPADTACWTNQAVEPAVLWAELGDEDAMPPTLRMTTGRQDLGHVQVGCDTRVGKRPPRPAAALPVALPKSERSRGRSPYPAASRRWGRMPCFSRWMRSKARKAHRALSARERPGHTGIGYQVSRRSHPFSRRVITAATDCHEDGMIHSFCKDAASSIVARSKPGPGRKEPTCACMCRRRRMGSFDPRYRSASYTTTLYCFT